MAFLEKIKYLAYLKKLFKKDNSAPKNMIETSAVCYLDGVALTFDVIISI